MMEPPVGTSQHFGDVILIVRVAELPLQRRPPQTRDGADAAPFAVTTCAYCTSSIVEKYSANAPVSVLLTCTVIW